MENNADEDYSDVLNIAKSTDFMRTEGTSPEPFDTNKDCKRYPHLCGCTTLLQMQWKMTEQGYDELTGQAKITPAYNLPCKYVILTEGPIVSGRLTDMDCEMLKSCYLLSCLNEAVKNGLNKI